MLRKGLDSGSSTRTRGPLLLFWLGRFDHFRKLVPLPQRTQHIQASSSFALTHALHILFLAVAKGCAVSNQKLLSLLRFHAVLLLSLRDALADLAVKLFQLLLLCEQPLFTHSAHRIRLGLCMMHASTCWLSRRLPRETPACMRTWTSMSSSTQPSSITGETLRNIPQHKMGSSSTRPRQWKPDALVSVPGQWRIGLHLNDLDPLVAHVDRTRVLCGYIVAAIISGDSLRAKEACVVVISTSPSYHSGFRPAPQLSPLRCNTVLRTVSQSVGFSSGLLASPKSRGPSV